MLTNYNEISHDLLSPCHDLCISIYCLQEEVTNYTQQLKVGICQLQKGLRQTFKAESWIYFTSWKQSSSV